MCLMTYVNYNIYKLKKVPDNPNITGNCLVPLLNTFEYFYIQLITIEYFPAL